MVCCLSNLWGLPTVGWLAGWRRREAGTAMGALAPLRKRSTLGHCWGGVGSTSAVLRRPSCNSSPLGSSTLPAGCVLWQRGQRGAGGERGRPLGLHRECCLPCPALLAAPKRAWPPGLQPLGLHAPVTAVSLQAGLAEPPTSAVPP